MKKRMLFRGAFILGLIILSAVDISKAQYQYKDEPLLQIIQDIQEETSYQFLYREVLVADIKLSFQSNQDHIFTSFKKALGSQGLNLATDKAHKQAIIYSRNNGNDPSQTISISGQVVDAKTGERLPYATIQWEQATGITGVSSNESGNFTINQKLNQKSFDIRCSYVGYSPKTVTLDFSSVKKLKNLTFRLEPTRIDGNNLVVVGGYYYSNINQQTANLVNTGTFSPLGETNTLRALQTLPAVSPSPAMSDGLHVRGSPADGFKVLLDGIPIYNQTHLFGLVDSFNADVLKRSGFYYDIAPATFKAPPGGTLSLLTKTGSLKQISGSGGLSNASVRFSLDGPIKKGHSSWLISGRKSYMNTINWFNNNKLIRFGLNVNRNQSEVKDGLINFQSKLVRPQDSDASFFDLHGKIYVEGKEGNRLILSGYFGGDDTRLNANRLFRSFSTSGTNAFKFKPVTTKNDWHNGAASAQYKYWLGEDIYSTSTVGTSIYVTSFRKDAFTYTDVNHTDQSLQAFVFAFENKSVLNQFKAKQQFELNANPWLWTGGISYNYYSGQYLEHSFDRPGYFSSLKAHQLDAFVQLDYTGLKFMNISSGTRVHYYSNGDYLKWSPRLKVKLFPDSKISLGAGFSRNYQFLNQIALSNTVTSNVWILANRDQPPTSVNYYSAGIYFTPSDFLYAQTEAYTKEFDNIRLHELNTFSLSNTFNTNPWFVDNSGTAKGIEFLLRGNIPFASLTQTFNLSEVTLSNPSINNGKSNYADWDRKYEYTATLELNPFDNLSLYLAWTYASGTPNRLATFGPSNVSRLDNYRRTDISAEYKKALDFGDLSLSFSIYNLTNRNNPWYRDLHIALDQNKSPNQLLGAPVDIYDIGIQPSFNIGISF